MLLKDFSMKELYAEIPDPDVVLALEPEELGGKLLFLLKRHCATNNRGTFHPGNLISEVMSSGDRSRGIGVIPARNGKRLALQCQKLLLGLRRRF
jgi:hypothetical protein